MATYEVLAASHNTLDVGAAFLGGLLIAGALVWAIHFGMKVRDQESPRPPRGAAPPPRRRGRP